MTDYSYVQETADKCLSCNGSPDLVREKSGWIIVCNDCNRSTTNPTFKLWRVVVEWNQRQRLSYDNISQKRSDILDELAALNQELGLE